MEDKMNKRHFFLFIFLFIGLFIFAYRNLLSVDMIAFGDLRAFSTKGSAVYLNSFLSSWRSLGLGDSYGGTRHHLFFAFVSFIFGDNPIVAQKIFYFSLLPLAGLAMYVLAGHFTKKWPARFIAAFIYAINPVSIGQFSGGGPGILSTYVILPVLSLFLYKIIEGEGWQIRNMFIFAVFLALICSFNQQTLLIIAPVVLVLFFVNVLMSKNLVYASKKFILFLIISPILWFFLMLPQSLFAFSFVTSGGPAIAGSVGSTVENLLMDVKHTYSACGIQNLLRISGNAGAYDWWLGYGKVSSFWTIPGFLLSFLAFLALLFKNNRKTTARAITFSVLAILVILFCWLNKQGLLKEIFLRFPPLLMYRNPVQMLMLLPLAYCSLVAITLDTIRNRIVTSSRISLSRTRRFVVLFIFYFFILGNMSIYLWPFFTGDMGISRLRDNNHTVPPMYSKVSRWLNHNRQTEEFFRILMLPYTHETSLRLASDLNLIVVNDESNILTEVNKKYSGLILDSLCNEKTNKIGTMLSLAGVRYVIIDLLSPEKGKCRIHGLYAYGDPKNFIEVLNGQENLELVVGEKDFLIYENRNFVSYIAVKQ